MPNEACCLSQLELVAYQRQEINSLFILIKVGKLNPFGFVIWVVRCLLLQELFCSSKDPECTQVARTILHTK